MKNLGSSDVNVWQVSKDAVSLVRPLAPSRPVTIPARPQTLTFDLSRSAILVVDMQNDFCHPDGWLASIGVDVEPVRKPIPVLQKILPDLRSAGVPVIWINWGNRPDRSNLSPSVLHVYNSDGESLGIGDCLPGQTGGVLEEGSWNAAIVDELSTGPTDIHVSKYRMSGFWDTPLDSILRNLRVDTLLFSGVNVDQCVMSTLSDAGCLGYDTVLLEDCCATTSPQYCFDATLYNVRQCFGFTAMSHELRLASTAGVTP